MAVLAARRADAAVKLDRRAIGPKFSCVASLSPAFPPMGRGRCSSESALPHNLTRARARHLAAARTTPPSSDIARMRHRYIAACRRRTGKIRTDLGAHRETAPD